MSAQRTARRLGVDLPARQLAVFAIECSEGDGAVGDDKRDSRTWSSGATREKRTADMEQTTAGRAPPAGEIARVATEFDDDSCGRVVGHERLCYITERDG
jgi:hypothetical protein